MLLAGLIAALALAGRSAGAQGDDSCRAKVLLAMSRAGAACANLEPGQACAGNGAVLGSFQPGAGELTFGAPGDRVPLSTLRRVEVGGASDEWSVALMQLRANLAESEQRSITLLAFGRVSFEDFLPPVPEIVVTGTAVVYVRTTPDDAADISAEYGLRDRLVANGRTDDDQWLRVMIPGTNQLGWVSRAVITPEASLATLTVVDENSPFYRPFQVFTLSTGFDDALCPGAPESGILLQTPNSITFTTLSINAVTLRLAATAFLQTQPDGTLVVSILDGQAEVDTGPTVRYIPAGARVSIAPDGPPAQAEPYDYERMAALPLNSLPYRFVLAEPPDQEAIDTLTAQHFLPTPTPLSPEQIEGAQTCVRRMTENASLWAGPGMFYEVVNPIAAGTRVWPVLQATDAEGIMWWQLTNSNWVRASIVESTGNCEPVPIAERIPAPGTNHLSLETCTTTNGPLRVGQWVTIDFVPQAVTTYQEAEQMTRTDPGRITVGNVRLRVTASTPVKIADERYIRTFSGGWEAVAGSYRVTGRWLSYALVCDITVPLGY